MRKPSEAARTVAITTILPASHVVRPRALARTRREVVSCQLKRGQFATPAEKAAQAVTALWLG